MGSVVNCMPLSAMVREQGESVIEKGCSYNYNGKALWCHRNALRVGVQSCIARDGRLGLLKTLTFWKRHLARRNLVQTCYSRTWIYRNEKFCMGGTEKIPIYRGIRYIYPCPHTNYPCRALPNFAAFSDIQNNLYVVRYNGFRYIKVLLYLVFLVAVVEACASKFRGRRQRYKISKGK